MSSGDFSPAKRSSNYSFLHEDLESVLAKGDDENINSNKAEWENDSEEWLDEEAKETIACLAERFHVKEKVVSNFNVVSSSIAINLGTEIGVCLGDSIINMHSSNHKGSGTGQEVNYGVNHAKDVLQRGGTDSCMKQAEVDIQGPNNEAAVANQLNALGNMGLDKLAVQIHLAYRKFQAQKLRNLASISSAINLLFQTVSSKLDGASSSHVAALAGSSSFKNHEPVNIAEFDSAGSPNAAVLEGSSSRSQPVANKGCELIFKNSELVNVNNTDGLTQASVELDYDLSPNEVNFVPQIRLSGSAGMCEGEDSLVSLPIVCGVVENGQVLMIIVWIRKTKKGS
ncbi:hypothetical protein VNO78_29149 [Psophocarpus tetragonolobus]|uniref:Uncharacterized protein n=1 Tax=Psophocarpus tetragonolobus TaxID=3891 RepID=A0AAN9RUC7_PSOTE